MKGYCRLLVFTILASLQFTYGFAQEIELRGGASIIPSIYSSLRYEHYSNSMIHVAGGVFVESAKQKPLSYSSLGIDLLAQYKSNTEDHPIFSYKAGLGLSCELQNEPWVYQDWPVAQRFNYGIALDAGGIVHLSDAFLLSAFLQQKFLFHKILGTTHFIFGLGLSYQPGL